jgi:hypothetical protein
VLDLRLHLREEVGELDVGGEQEGPARRGHQRVVALQHVQLLLGAVFSLCVRERENEKREIRY